MTPQTSGRPSLAIYLPDLSGGGAERLYLTLAPAFVEAGFAVEFLLDRSRGELLNAVPAGIPVRSLGAERQLKALPRLVATLRHSPPDLLLSAMEHMNVTAIAAKLLARAPTRIVVSQHNALSHQARRPGLKNAALPWLYSMALPRAAGIIAVSDGVADETARLARLPRARISVIYNGTVNAERSVSAASRPAWWPRAQRVVLAVGRFVPQKDHATLLRAFATLQRPDDALVLLGEGPLRAELEQLAASLGIGAQVLMPGFLDDPLPAMAAADVLALSSRYEGFGLVLAEAMSCGTPVVSTDCEFGPSEILDNGRFGRLVAVGDPAALATALAETLESPLGPEILAARGKTFSVANCAAGYIAEFRRILAR